MGVIHLEGNDQFKSEIMDFDGVVILDFWAEWCGPCRMLGPVMEELAADNEGKNVKIVKVDIEGPGNEELVQKFQVSSIPAVFVIKAGEVIKPIVGVNPKEVYQAEIDALLVENIEQVEKNVKMDNSAGDLQKAAGVIHLEGVDQYNSEIKEFNGVVILDFWAEWCGPCRMLGPVMEELAADNAGKNVKIVKADVEGLGNEKLVQDFEVSSIPAVFVIKDGKIRNSIIGVNTKETYQAEIDVLLAEKAE